MSDHFSSQEDTGGKGRLEVSIPPPLPHSWDECEPAWGCSAPRPGDSEHLQVWKFPSLSGGWTTLRGKRSLPLPPDVRKLTTRTRRRFSGYCSKQIKQPTGSVAVDLKYSLDMGRLAGHWVQTSERNPGGRGYEPVFHTLELPRKEIRDCAYSYGSDATLSCRWM